MGSIRAATAFPGVAVILRLDTEVTRRGAEVRRETRSAITSRGGDEVSPRRLRALGRGHWGVEDGLHSLKDRWWDEDRQWSRRPGLAARLATSRDVALTA